MQYCTVDSSYNCFLQALICSHHLVSVFATLCCWFQQVLVIISHDRHFIEVSIPSNKRWQSLATMIRHFSIHDARTALKSLAQHSTYGGGALRNMYYCTSVSYTHLTLPTTPYV